MIMNNHEERVGNFHPGSPDLSAAFSWTSTEDARRIKADGDAREIYAEWQREQRRKKTAKRSYLAWACAMVGLLFLGIAMIAAANESRGAP